MVINEIPVIELRVGYSDERLFTMVSRFNQHFLRLPSPSGKTEQDFLYVKEPERYIVMAFERLKNIYHFCDYNFEVGFAAENSDLVKKVMDDFRKATGITLRDAPEIPRKIMQFFAMPILWDLANSETGRKEMGQLSSAVSAQLN